VNVSDMLTDINGHGFQDTSDTDKVALINDTIWDVGSREPWPFLTKSVNLNFDGTNPYPTNMPVDFRAVQWLADLSTGEAIWPERLETVRDRYSSTTTPVDTPFLFYFVGEQLRLYPTPPASIGRFLLDYYAVQVAVTSSTLEASILMPPRHHRVYVLGTLAKLYSREDDNDLAAQKMQEYEQRLERMKEDFFRKQYMRPDRVFVTDETDDLYPWWP
jgi:hypothetical protein